jgi:Ca-activated chloride channel family protein
MLAGVIAVSPLVGTQASARQVHVNVHVELPAQLRQDLARASQIVIPQSGGARGFVLEQRGQAVEITSVEARVNILERTARTQMEIALRNPGSQQIEAILLLPVPDGAVVSNFMFDGAASEPTAQIMRREEARSLYESIVNRVRDPALLEFAGYNLIRTSVFPVTAGGTQKVRLTYENLLGGDDARVDFVLPRSESLDRRSPWKIAIDVQSQHEIASAYSPSHDILTQRLSKNHLKVTLAESSATDPGAFMLSYLLVRNGNGGGLPASMFAYPDTKIGAPPFDGKGGYFLLMAGLPASITDSAQKVKREVTIVIDRSGSMAGVKMDQARAAALQVVEGLENGERFNIIDYSTSVASFAPSPVEKTNETRLAARKYIEAIKPVGGTNIHDALVEALRAPPAAEFIPIVLFLTDGLPTVGNASETAIRELAEKGNPHHRRIFTFGVGNDVNVPLLDRIADVTRASTTYVLPEENVELKVAAVFKRLYGPVMSDITIETLDAEGKVSTQLVRDLIPSKIPDLFEDDQLILLGQYATGQPVKFRLRGNYLGKERVFDMAFDFDGSTTRNAFVPRLWAARRIAYLVDQIRQAGAEFANRVNAAGTSIFDDPKYRELSDEVLRLSTEFGILTEYTAFLATEGTNLNDWNTLSAACGTNLDHRAVQQRWGAAAVNQGVNFNAQKGQSKLNYDNRYVDANLQQVEYGNVQQMCDRAFYKRGEQWIDAQIVASQAEAQKSGAMTQNQQITPDQTIAYGSPEHFALLEQLVQQNRQGVLSLNGDILIVHDGKSILVKNLPSQN